MEQATNQSWRIELTPEDAAISDRWRGRLVHWMRAREQAGSPVSIGEACGVAMRATHDYLHFSPAISTGLAA